VASRGREEAFEKTDDGKFVIEMPIEEENQPRKKRKGADGDRFVEGGGEGGGRRVRVRVRVRVEREEGRVERVERGRRERGWREGRGFRKEGERRKG
jgi:hypothetical protein